MPRATDIRLNEVRHKIERIGYRTPMKFGGRVVTDAVLLHIWADVETRAGQSATGHGSMPLGNAWAWPSQVVSGEITAAVMQALGVRLAELASQFREWGHPLEITRSLAHDHSSAARALAQQHHLPEPIPRLAQLVCASPIEAAVHDAYGLVHSANSYDLLGPDFVNCDLGAMLHPDFAGQYLDRYTSRVPQARMPLYHLVGALDPLIPADVIHPVGDGLPETLGQWIANNGLTHLKIKLAGDDLEWDVARVAAVEQVAAGAQAARGCRRWHYSCDFNERCADVGYVLEFLDRVASLSPVGYERIQYIEQPTHRELRAHPENRMHAAARRKPVVIDESLIDLESLEMCREMGYSGVALKACKGQTEALLMGAAAQRYAMFLCVQDLTCPGASFLQSAGLAARIPGVAAIEGNGRQYCPAGNRGWEDRFPGMFRVKDGTVHTAELSGPGLGYAAPARSV